MRLFYFTYGSEGHPFVGGWTMVAAQDMDKAVTAFRAYHPDTAEGLMCCAGVYTEQQFLGTRMALDGNLGRRCHELIYLSCTKEG